MYLGYYEIDDYVTFAANTHDPTDGSATDVDAGYNGGVPAYRIYEDETGTAIVTGSMAKLDDTNTTGFYSERIELSDDNGFEVGKNYTIYISAQVNSVVGTMSHTFKVVPFGTSEGSYIEQAENVIDVCNFALAILNGAINASYPFLDSWDEDATSQEALATLRWMKVCYPRARNRMQSLWDWPACLRFAAMGAELSSASAHTVPGWEYVYSKPEGCLAFRGIVAADVHETTGKLTEYPFIEIGSQIACNVHNDDDDDPDYLFKYNVLVQNPGDWGEDLYQATAFLLAYYASRAMGATLENQAVVKQLYEDAFATARSGCQGSTFELRPDVQTGGSVELGPGNIDWKFPLPE